MLRVFLMTLLLAVWSGAAFADCTSPASPAGRMDYFGAPDNTFKFCNGADWVDMGASASGGDTCGGIGGQCADGSIYAGLSLDGRVPMYTTPGDAPSTYGWGPSSDTAIVNCVDLTETGCRTGKANSALLNGSYPAATHCNNLVVHGKSDWYLPSIEELATIYGSKGSIGGFLTDTYWSSSEVSGNDALYAGTIFTMPLADAKTNPSHAVRCVRR